MSYWCSSRLSKHTRVALLCSTPLELLSCRKAIIKDWRWWWLSYFSSASKIIAALRFQSSSCISRLLFFEKSNIGWQQLQKKRSCMLLIIVIMIIIAIIKDHNCQITIVIIVISIISIITSDWWWQWLHWRTAKHRGRDRVGGRIAFVLSSSSSLSWTSTPVIESIYASLSWLSPSSSFTIVTSQIYKDTK